MSSHKLIRLTESDLHKIVNESVKRIIQENYAARHFSKRLSEITESFIEIKKWIDEYYAEGNGRELMPEQKSEKYGIEISLKPFFGEDAKIPPKYLENEVHNIRINYNNHIDNHVVTGSFNPSLLHRMGYQIELYVPFNATYEDIYTALEHEVTHLVDALISECKGYAEYGYPVRQMNDFGIPNYAKMLLYALWSNTEFNAWQANHRAYLGDNDFLDVMMNYLKEAYESNDKIEWNNIQQFLLMKWHNNASIVNRRGIIPEKDPLAFKKYFIKTTLKKLKKMVKKYY